METYIHTKLTSVFSVHKKYVNNVVAEVCLSSEYKYKCGCHMDDECTTYDGSMVCHPGNKQCVCQTGWTYNVQHNRCVLGK